LTFLFVALVGLGLLPCVAAKAADSSPARISHIERVGNYALATTYSMEDPLPLSYVEMRQTTDGYLWVAMHEGLARFDGVNFTTFTTQNSPGLVSTNIHRMLQDSDGNLWILANWGLSCYKNHAFTDFTPKLQAHNDGRVRVIELDNTGHLLVGCDRTFYRYENGAFRYLGSCPSIFGDDGWVSFTRANDGSLWIAGSGLVYQVNESGAILQPIPGWKSDPRVFVECCDHGGHVWVSSHAGLLQEVHGKLTLRVSVGSIGGQAPSYCSADAQNRIWFVAGGVVYSYSGGRLLALKGTPAGVTRISLDAHGDLWAIADQPSQSIVARYHDDQFQSYVIQPAISKGWDVPVTRDNQGDIWASTISGICCIRTAPCRTYGPADGLPPNRALTTVFRDSRGTIWIGTDGAGLGRLSNGRFVAVKDPLLSNGSVASIAESPRGVLWVGRDGKLIRYDAHTAQDWTPKLGLSPLDPGVGSLCVDHSGTLWVGSGKALIEIHGSSLQKYVAGAVLPDDYDRAGVIVPARGGGVLIGTQQGLIRFDHGRTTVDYHRAVGLPLVPVVDIHEDDNGTLWLATWGDGIYQVVNGKFVHIGLREGLFADNVHQILDDGDGNFWIGSAKGIFRVRRADLDAYADGIRKSFTCFSYGDSDGASGGETWSGSQPSGMRTPDGQLWFATLGGLVVCRTQVSHRPPPVTRLEELFANQRAVLPTAAVDIPPGAGTLEVHYTGLDYLAPQSVRFRYMLRGFDDVWQMAGTRRVAYYTNLPPGTYTFVVSASNGEGVWGAPASISIRLHPYFYQTWWCRTVTAVAALCILCAMFEHRRRQVMCRNRELERAVDERTHQLKEAHEEVTAQNDKLQSMQIELEAQNEELVDAKAILESQNIKLESLATTDGLTGLKNHRAFQDKLVEEWAYAQRYGTPLSMLLIDVDKFKQFNDTFGHPAGDEVLKRVGAILQSNSRETDFVARYGGEEFVVILSNTDVDSALEAGERYRAAIAAADWTLRKVTASFGASTMSDSMEAPANLIAEADSALYLSKERGRNLVTHFFQSEQSKSKVA
jgi:diguanylate cyclase (GGDEF)-like protein